MSRIRRVARVVLISLVVGTVFSLGGAAASADTIWNVSGPNQVQAASSVTLLDTIWN